MIGNKITWLWLLTGSKLYEIGSNNKVGHTPKRGLTKPRDNRTILTTQITFDIQVAEWGMSGWDW